MAWTLAVLALATTGKVRPGWWAGAQQQQLAIDRWQGPLRMQQSAKDVRC